MTDEEKEENDFANPPKGQGAPSISSWDDEEKEKEKKQMWGL